MNDFRFVLITASMTPTMDVQKELCLRSGNAATSTDLTPSSGTQDGSGDLEIQRYPKRRRIITKRALSHDTTLDNQLSSDTSCRYNNTPEPLETSDAAGAATNIHISKPVIEVRVPGLLFPKSVYVDHVPPLPPMDESRVLKELLVCKCSYLKLRC